MLNWIDALFFGVRRIFGGGIELPERPALNFIGAICTDNPAENRTDVAFVGTTIRKISPVLTANYTASPGELVRVDAQDPVTIILPPAAANAGMEVIVKEVAGNKEQITLVTSGDEDIDGEATKEIGGAYAKVWVVSDGARWVMV